MRRAGQPVLHSFSRRNACVLRWTGKIGKAIDLGLSTGYRVPGVWLRPVFCSRRRTEANTASSGAVKLNYHRYASVCRATLVRMACAGAGILVSKLHQKERQINRNIYG